MRAAFARIFQTDTSNHQGEPCFDRLLHDGEYLQIGHLRVRAMHLPGHTPADMAYLVEGVAAFVGDTIFMPDVGTARCDFPGGDARQLYRSIQRLFQLPASSALYLCHDYPPPGRAPASCTIVAQRRADNIRVRDGVEEDSFYAMRTARDRTLSLPALILPSIQVNLEAGRLPPLQRNGIRYLQIPLDIGLTPSSIILASLL